jgi:hypothetical protein
MPSVNETVLKALDDAFSDGIKGLYGAAVANAAGGDSIDAIIERFTTGLTLEIAVHARILQVIIAATKELENG